MRWKTFTKNPLFTIALAIGLILNFTPYYTYGAALALAALALFAPLFKNGFFRPISTRLIATFLVFSAWIMTIATYAWVAHITMPLPVYLLSFLVTYLVAYKVLVNKPDITINQVRLPTLRQTLLSILLSTLGIAIMGGSFYVSDPNLASSIQIITNGYDNSAHLSIIQTTYEANGYVYGPYDQIKDQIAWKTLTAYPQGWHFTNAYLWKGTGLHFFGDNTIPLDLSFYIVTVFGWYFIALFIFHQLLWSAVQKAASHIHSVNSIGTFVFASTLIQLLVFWGSLQFGFVTFLGALVFTFLLIATILEAPYKIQKQAQLNSLIVLFAISLLLVAAVAQGWLFASPVVGVILGVAHLPLIVDVINRRVASRKQIIATLALGLFALAPIAIQILINKNFSTQGTSQINDDGGIFGISTTLAAIIIGLVIIVISSSLVSDKLRAKRLTAIVLPPLIFTALLFTYQLITLGHPAYFFTKLLAYTLCILWIPLTEGATRASWLIASRVGMINTLGLMAVVFLMLPLMFGQNMDSFTKLLQRNSNVSVNAADDIAKTAEDGTLRHKKTFVFTGENINGDTIGTIFTSTVNEEKSRCDGVGWLISKGQNSQLPRFLNPCAATEEIQIITSPAMDQTILNQLDNRITIIK